MTAIKERTHLIITGSLSGEKTQNNIAISRPIHIGIGLFIFIDISTFLLF
jgi:hypothetical protein